MSQSGAGRLLSPMGGQRGAGRDRVDPLQGLDRFIADPIIRVVQRFHHPGDGRGVTDQPQGLGRPPADLDVYACPDPATPGRRTLPFTSGNTSIRTGTAETWPPTPPRPAARGRSKSRCRLATCWGTTRRLTCLWIQDRSEEHTSEL